MAKNNVTTMKRNLIIILLVTLIIFLVGGYFFLSKTGKLSLKADTAGPSLTLQPNTSSINVGSTLDVNLKMDTAGLSASGVQIEKIHFNPAILQVIDADSVAAGVQIAKGSITSFETPLDNTVDNSAGTISYSVSSFTNNYIGNDTLAIISFKAIANATASLVTFDFDGTAAKTVITDSVGSNILTSVGLASFDIVAPVSAPTVSLKANGSDGPISVISEAAASLSWTSANTSSCNATGDWSGSKSTLGNESTGVLTVSKTYVLTCTGVGGSANATVVVNVETSSGGTSNSTSGSGTTDTEATPTLPAIPNIQTTPTPSSKTVTAPSKLTPVAPVQISKLPLNIQPTSSPQSQKSSIALFKNDTMKPWTLWFLYAIIPAFLAGGAIYFYLKRKKLTDNSINNELI